METKPMINAELDALRTSFQGCTLVAFGDARTRLMLRSSHEGSCQREYLDDLCEQAAQGFNLLDAASRVMGGLDRPSELAVLTKSGSKVFVRAQDEGADFLCCICDSSDNPVAISDAANETLKKIVGDY